MVVGLDALIAAGSIKILAAETQAATQGEVPAEKGVNVAEESLGKLAAVVPGGMGGQGGPNLP
jgi:hypothetical protein